MNEFRLNFWKKAREWIKSMDLDTTKYDSEIKKYE